MQPKDGHKPVKMQSEYNTLKRGKQKMSTIKDLKRWYDCYSHCVTGYCCEQNITGKSKYDLVKLGYNAGVYGWNWTAYADNETDTMYVSYYRNVPAYIREK